jgi:hypothetical protein
VNHGSHGFKTTEDKMAEPKNSLKIKMGKSEAVKRTRTANIMVERK